MFSEDALVTMANGGFKPIKEIMRGDFILNKFGKRTSVLSLKTSTDSEAIRIQLDNGTGTFYISPTTIVFGHYRTPDLRLISEYSPISQIHEKDGYIKSDLKIFSPDSDVQIESYTPSEPQTLYSIVTSDNSQSYKVNNIIVSNKPSQL